MPFFGLQSGGYIGLYQVSIMREPSRFVSDGSGFDLMIYLGRFPKKRRKNFIEKKHSASAFFDCITKTQRSVAWLDVGYADEQETKNKQAHDVHMPMAPSGR